MRNVLMWCASLAAAGCATDTSTTTDTSTQPTSSQTTGFAQQAMAMSSQVAGMAGQFGPSQGPPPQIAMLSCGAQPQITTGTVCGHDYPASVELAWTGCSPHAGVTTSGSAHVTNQITVNGACGSGATLAIDHQAHLVLDATRDGGGTMHSDGTVHVTGARTMGAPPSSLQVDVDLTRSMQGAMGALSAHATGSLSISPAACGFPIGGSLDISIGGASHVLAFGPACGQATLDGAAVTLPLTHGGPGGFGGPPGM